MINEQEKMKKRVIYDNQPFQENPRKLQQKIISQQKSFFGI